MLQPILDSPYFKQFACLNNWKAVTANDMRTFAATLLFWVWSTSWNLKNIGQGRHSQVPPFLVNLCLKITSRAFLANFHVANDTQNPPFSWPGHNPLTKLQPMIDMISASFKTAYKPGKNISVDEGCCPWKGRLRFRQYNPRKPANFISNSSK